MIIHLNEEASRTIEEEEKKKKRNNKHLSPSDEARIKELEKKNPDTFPKPPNFLRNSNQNSKTSL